ncbi:MAG: metallophosphoesterase [Acidobacteriota bacterium]|nr:metallophosphoesterase [Acidobacteriota bacterium]
MRQLPIAARQLGLALFFTVSCAAQQPPVTAAGQTPAQAPPQAPAQPAPKPVDPQAVGVLPNRDGSLKFMVIGDMGTGDRGQYDTATQMFTQYQRFKFKMSVMVGDNMYGSQRPADYTRKFEQPYGPLLKAGVKFYAALGNHDEREQRLYSNFNMNGKYYYSMKAPDEDVRFFFLESTYPDEAQLKWIDTELGNAKEKWKIVVFHHPLYSSAGRHGSSIPLRKVWEPLFIKHNVSVAFNGHDHTYERVKPQNGIVYFVVGSSGKLAPGDLRNNAPLTASGFDTDQTFLLVEIDEDVMYFQAVSRTGRVVDSGTWTRRFTADEKK